MTFTVAASALALAASQLKPVSVPASVTLAALAAITLAAVGLLRGQQDIEQTRRWTQARSVAEAIKAEVYTFLAQSGEGQPADREERERKLDAEIQRLEREARNLQPYAQGVRAKPRRLPAVGDVETYLDVRVRSQLEEFYEPKAIRLRTQLRYAKTVEVILTLIAAALAAVAALAPSVGAWAAVVTTAVGAVTAYVASERYEFLWGRVQYHRQRAPSAS